jgi:hypothetical protein
LYKGVKLYDDSTPETVGIPDRALLEAYTAQGYQEWLGMESSKHKVKEEPREEPRIVLQIRGSDREVVKMQLRLVHYWG